MDIATFEHRELVRIIDTETRTTHFPDDVIEDVLAYARATLGLSEVDQQRLRARWEGAPNMSGVVVYLPDAN